MSYIISILFNWPLYMALKIKADILKDKYALMWYEDASNSLTQNLEGRRTSKHSTLIIEN